MMRTIFVRSCAIVSMMVGVVVMLGWIFDIPAIKSVFFFAVTMKFATALSFFLTGTMLLLLTVRQPPRKTLILLASIQLIIMGTFFIGTLLGRSIGVEKLFFSVSDSERFSGVPGYPSVMTSLLFVLVNIAFLRCKTTTSQCLFWIGWLAILIGSLCVIGYVFSIPQLYYYVHTLSSFSTAMAVHTGALFIVIGLGMVSSAQRRIL